MIVADRNVNIAIQKGIQISRSTIRWYDHNDLKSLEDVLISIEKERKKRRSPLTRRFIITEGIFERDGEMVDLPKLVCQVTHSDFISCLKWLIDRAQTQVQVPTDP